MPVPPTTTPAHDTPDQWNAVITPEAAHYLPYFIIGTAIIGFLWLIYQLVRPDNPWHDVAGKRPDNPSSDGPQ